MESETWNPRRVVAATDGSEGSIHAARVAAGLARHHGAKLFVVTVVRPPEGWWGIGGAPPPPDVLSEALAEAQKAVLDRTLEALDLEDVEHEAVEEYGDPAARLIGFCEEQDADLLVVGRRGAGFIERLVMGSVADRVAHEATCPVLIVP